MLKKAIAGVLSAVMCASTLLYDAPFSSRNTAQEGEQMPAASTGAQEDFGLTGSNSLSRYLAKQGTEQAANAQPAAQPLKASAADAVFAVTNLDFDRETGIIQVTSTQSEAATLRASFIDEDSPANVYTVDCGVPAGEYVHSTFSTDAAQLPAYFTVSVQLVGRAGLPLCKAFELKTYNREMQDILEKETSDFAPEQVVNFDEDETTNFIVLSEDTVRAETTEESNVLVSADYDQNIYVFDHIDDSIRSLEKGQYFYIQPTEDDIISTDIREIVIDGDTATITGTGEIDDMFDFIKIESERECSVEGEYYGNPYYGVNAQVISNEEELNDRLHAVDPDAELSEYTKKNSVSTEFNLGKSPIKITPSLNYEVTTKWNIYKKFHYLNLFLVTETKVTINVKAETEKADDDDAEDSDKKDDDKKDDDKQDDDKQDDDKKDDEKKKKDHLIEIPLYTNGAVDVNLIGDVEIDLNGEIEVEVGLQFTKGFVFDSKDGFEWIMFDTDPVLKKFEAQVEFSIEVKLGVEIKALKGLLKASVSGGLKGTATVKAESGTFTTLKKTGNNVFQPDPAATSETIHCDEKCLKIRLEVKLVISAEVSAGFEIKDTKNGLGKLASKLGADKLKVSKEKEMEFDSVLGHKLPVYDLYVSQNSSGVYKGVKFNFVKVPKDQETECPHKAFRVTFNFNLENAPAGISALDIKVNVDGTSFDVNSDKLVLYAMPRSSSYSYTVSAGSIKYSGRSFRITDSTVDIPVTLKWPAVETGTGKPSIENGGVQTGKAITTVTEPNITEPFVFDYSDKIPSVEMRNKRNHTYDLGEHISGMFNNDGSFLVYGYGDMYPNASAEIPSSVRNQIREIQFMDQDPENGLYINNIAKSLFEYSTNLEVVYMPERLKEIGDSAFSGCKNLKWLRYSGEDDTTETFQLPDTLTTIGNSAFLNCSSAELGDLVIPKSVTHIGKSAFEGCLKLYSVTIPDENITEVMQHVFQKCSGLKEAYFGPGVTCPDTAYCHWFHYCDALEKLTIPTFILGPQCSILSDLFSSVSGVSKVLTDVTVLSGTVIPANYFAGVSQLEKVTYPGNITEIGNSAFSGCSGLLSAPLPETLTTIGNSAFLNCSSADFGELRIPDSVTMIGSSAFEGCDKLTSVMVPGVNETSVMQHVFQRCAGLKKAYFGPGVTCPDTAYCHWFHYCAALEKLTIPNFLLGPKCKSLGDLFSNGASGVAPTLTDVTVLSGTVIPASYFSGVSQLKHVAYPDEVTEIGSSAFSGCTNLVSLEPLANSGDPTVGGTVDPEYGDLIISENVTLIQKNAFTNCLKIRTVTVPGTNGTAIMEHVFQDCTGLQEAYFGPGVTCPDTGYCHWFHGCTSVAKLVLPAFSLGPRMNTLSDLFSGSASAVPKTLTNVTVTDGTVIPKDYFKEIGTIASVTFSSALESVETNAFNGCTALAEAYLIGEDADWDNVDINATGNQPLLALVRKGCFSVILSDPKDEVVEEERIAAFTVYAASKGNLSYLWQYSQDGGSNWWSMDCYSNKLTFTASMEQNGTLYHCIVIDQNGFRQTSADAKLTVTEKTVLPAAKQPEETPSEQTEQTPRDPKTLPGYKPGDANGDGSIDVSDAVLIARFAVGDTSVTIKDIGVINGDVNGDGNTDIQDVTFILMYIVRKIREFPVAEG